MSLVITSKSIIYIVIQYDNFNLGTNLQQWLTQQNLGPVHNNGLTTSNRFYIIYKLTLILIISQFTFRLLHHQEKIKQKKTQILQTLKEIKNTKY